MTKVNDASVIDEYSEAIIELCSGIAPRVVKVLDANPDREMAIFIPLTIFCLILTYRRMAVQKVGFFKTKSTIDSLLVSLANKSDMGDAIDQYRRIFQHLNKQYGNLPTQGETPAGTLLWEYTKYIIDRSQIEQKEDFFKAVNASEQLMKVNEDLGIINFVQAIK